MHFSSSYSGPGADRIVRRRKNSSQSQQPAMRRSRASLDASSTKMTHFSKRTSNSEKRLRRKPLLQLSPPVSPVQHNSTIAASRKRKRASPTPPAKSGDDANHVSDAESEIQDVIICASTEVFSDDETEDEREESPPAKRSLARRSISFDQVFQNGNDDDGEALTMERRFPAIYFDGSKFPEESAVGDFIRGQTGPTELSVKPAESSKPKPSALKSGSCSVSPQLESAPPVDDPVSSGTGTALSETTVPSSLVSPAFPEGRAEKSSDTLPEVQNEGHLAAEDVSSTFSGPPSSTPSEIADKGSEESCEPSGGVTSQTAPELDDMEVDAEAPTPEERETSLLATEQLEPLASYSDAIAMQIYTVEIDPEEKRTSLTALVQPDSSVSQEVRAQEVGGSSKDEDAIRSRMALPPSTETLSQAAELETEPLSPTTLPTTAQPVPSGIYLGQQTTAHSVDDTVYKAVEKLASSSEKAAEPEAFSQPADSKGDSPELAVASKTAYPTPPSPGPCLSYPVESRNQSISEHDVHTTLAAEASIAMEMPDYELSSQPHEEAAALSSTLPSPPESRIQGRRRSSAEPAKQSAPVAHMSITMEPDPQPTGSQPDSKPDPHSPERVIASPQWSQSHPAPSVDHCVESCLPEPDGHSTLATEASSLEPVSLPAEPEISPNSKTPKVKIAQPISPSCLKVPVLKPVAPSSPRLDVCLNAPVLQTSKFDSPKPRVSFKTPVQSFTRPAIGDSADNPIELETVSDIGSPPTVQRRLSAGRRQVPYSYNPNYSPMRMNDMSVSRNLIHRAHVKHSFFNHANADLHNLQSSSTSLSFPKPILGEESPSIHLSPARLSAAKSQSSSISGFRFLSSPPTTHTLSETPTPQLAKPSLAEQSPSAVVQPSTPQAIPQPVHRRIALRPAPKNHQISPASAEATTPAPLRFGIAPFEMPPTLLAIMRRKSKTKETNPKLSEFSGADGRYHCPMCEKRFARAGVFADHLSDRHWRRALNRNRQA